MKKTLLFASAALLAVGTIHGQRLQDGYVTWPASEQLHTYVKAWNGGNGTIQINGADFDDHNFFISRVKPRVRISNLQSQIRTNLKPTTISNGKVTAGNDKRLIFWVPISNEMNGDQRLNSLADGIFDGEMFSMWSYIDVYGNWNAPYGWTPGNFADICHKNGVAVHGVASVPFGSISSSWSTCFDNLCALNHTSIAKFLYFHGQDGLGYNSEWSGYAPSKLITLHDDLQTYMASRNPIWEVMWYGGTTEGGGTAFDTGVTSSNYPNLYKSASIFLNYNWNSTSTMSSSINYSANTIKKDPLYIYAGMNTQGGEPKSGSNYDLLKDYSYSIGLWGAHSINMYWHERFANGGSDLAKQQTYQKIIEQWFGNGPRNPAIQLTPTLVRNHRPNDSWAGMSSMMSERSTINHDIKNEPFVTYFNLGNGFFFNWKGERQMTRSWHNIGVQDFLPTWRFWFAPAFMQKNVTAGSTNLDAEFVWDDAYMGGSCLKVFGTTTDEYLHLFRTAITPVANFRILVRYKLLNGEADIDLAFSNTTDPNTEVTTKVIKTPSLLTVAESSDICDQSYAEGADGWITKIFTISSMKLGSITNGIGVIGLHFKNAKNMELLLGELAMFPGSDNKATETGITFATKPATPVITKATPLKYNPSGADIKVIWEMNNSKAVGEPVYNSDVKTSVFRMWAQQEGGEPINTGMTTSWAGICFGVPLDYSLSSTRIRVGVSAVSTDYYDESEIAWSDYLTLPAYEGNDLISINKAILKANESFELKFVDPLHVDATWKITNSDSGETVWTGNGHTVTCTTGCPEVGPYNVEVTFNGVTKTFNNFINVSPDASGALPAIYTMAVDADNVENISDAVTIGINKPRTFSYTGRDADGMASRGVEFQGNWVGVSISDLGLGQKQSFSVAAWVRFPVYNEGISNFLTIEDRAGEWPANNWGYFWSRINEDGKFIANAIDTAWGMRSGTSSECDRIFYKYADAKIEAGAWTHVAVVFDYLSGTNKVRQFLYINGVLQTVSVYVKCNKGSAEGILGSENGQWAAIEKLKSIAIDGVYGENTTQPAYAAMDRDLSVSDWIAFGGSSSNISSLEGTIDDFQVWGKAMTQSEVLASMTGLDANNLPADVLGFWDFESEATSTHQLVGVSGRNASNSAPVARVWRESKSSGEGQGGKVYLAPVYSAGTPQISGTNFPIVTKPSWEAGRAATIVGDGTGESGSATIRWAKEGDYTVTLTLANGHGSDSRAYPVVKVGDNLAAIDGIDTDADGVYTYTESNTIFVEFAADGNYDVQVYNVAGMLVGSKEANVTAGQNAQISIGVNGVYLVKVMKDGKPMRTVKVLVK